MPRRLLDRAVTALARAVVHLFFREVEVTGRERLPRGGPLIVVANHVNALVDPMLLLGCLGRAPRFLAKSTLWRNPLLRPLLGLARAVPVYRRQDEGENRSRNLETFDRCHRVLAAGGAVALFPEGVSHNQPALQPLHTGAARIALEAEERFGPLGVRIVPVGLTFDAKGSFRSRALVQVGEPIDPTSLRATEPQERVRELTERIGRGLAAVTLGFESWEEARLVERAADVWDTVQAELPGEQPFAAAVATRQAFVDGVARLRTTCPDEVAAVARAVASYDRLLTLLGVRDDQVVALYPRRLVAGFLGRTLLRMLATAPLAAVGTLLNFLPYLACDRIAALLGRTPDVSATYKLYPALALYPLTWAAEATLAWRLANPIAGAAVLILAPLSGWVAALFHERRARLEVETRAFLLLRSHPRLLAELRARRDELARAIGSLAERAG